MTSSSKQDNLDLLLDEETDNNFSNTQDGAQKDVSRAPLPALQPITRSNLAFGSTSSFTSKFNSKPTKY